MITKLINDVVDFSTVNSLESLTKAIFTPEMLDQIKSENERFLSVMSQTDADLLLANLALNHYSFDMKTWKSLKNSMTAEAIREYFERHLKPAELFLEYQKAYNAENDLGQFSPWSLHTDVDGAFSDFGSPFDHVCDTPAEYAAYCTAQLLTREDNFMDFDEDPLAELDVLALIDVMREHMSPEELKHMIPEVCYVASDELPAKIHDIYVAL